MFSTKAKQDLQNRIEKEPHYPWEFACEWTAKNIRKPKNLMGFVEDPPAVESMRADMYMAAVKAAETLQQKDMKENPEREPKALKSYVPHLDYVHRMLYELTKVAA